MVISVVILVGSIALGGAKLGTSYISTGDDKFLAVTYTPKPGETEKSVLDHAKQAQNIYNPRIK